MKKFFKILVAIFTVGFICLTATNISARGMYYSESAKSNVHSFKGFTQFFRVDAEMVMNGNKGSILSESIKWDRTKPSPTPAHSFWNSPDLGYTTTKDYREYRGSSSIQTSGTTDKKWLSTRIYF